MKGVKKRGQKKGSDPRRRFEVCVEGGFGFRGG